MAIILKALQNKSGLTDNEIIVEVLAGNRELYGRIIKKYNQRLYRIIRAYGIDDDDCEDLMQSTYISAFRNLESFQKKSKFSTWLIRIAINESLAYLRKQKIQTEKLYLIKSENNSSELDYENEEIKMILERAIEDLPEKYRVIFVMREIEELSGREVANILGLSESNVRVMLYRAKEMLKIDLSKKLGENEVFRFGNERCNILTERVLNIINQM
jgi:RNA polymerase sigma factor (sigma-70 family)